MKKDIISALMFSVCMAVFADPIKVTDESQLVYLEFVQANGNAGIKTKYVPNENTAVKFKGAFMKNVAHTRLFMNSVTVGQKTSTGATVSSPENHDVCRVIAQGSTSRIYANCSFRQDSAAAFSLSLSLGQIFEGEMDVNSVTINGQSLDTSAKPRTMDNPNEIILLDHEKNSSVRLYYVEFSEGDEVLYSFVPCAYNNVIGVYDKVNGEFYPQTLGTGTLSGSSFTVGIGDAYPLTSLGVEPEIVVRDYVTGEVLEKGVDYTVTYADNTVAGTASATVTHIPGGKCYGTTVVNFVIYSVYRVSPDAAGGGDGASWESPMSLTNALVKSVAGDKLLLKAGEYIVTNAILDISKGITVEGGYAGTDDATLDGEYPFSVLTQIGATLKNIASVSASSGDVVLRRLEIRNGGLYGMIKSGACNFWVENCNFVSNGFSYAEGAGVKEGKGLRITGTSASRTVVTNCYFAYNCCTDNNANRGGPGPALYIASSKSSLVVDCVFFGNCTFMGKAGSCSSSSTLFNVCTPGSAISVKTPVSVLRCDFRANTTNVRQNHGGVDSGGVIYFWPGSQGSTVSNCIFAGNFDRAVWNDGTCAKSGALVVQLGNISRKVTVYGSTFAHNFSDTNNGAGAITVVSGTIDISNCVFGGNTMHSGGNLASDIKVFAASAVNIEYSVLGGEKSTQVFCQDGGVFNEGEGVIYADPLFVTPSSFAADNRLYSFPYYYWPDTKAMYDKIAAIDVHLLSKTGYVTNGVPDQWLVSDSNSPAIDAGNPLDEYSNETKPNGLRRDAGAYGNTPEASKTYESLTPLGFSDVAVTYPSGYSRPNVAFTVAGDAGCVVDVTIFVTMEDGSTFSDTIAGCLAGSTYEYLFPDYYDTRTKITFSIAGTSTAGVVSPADREFEVETSYPPWRGHGGGEGVLHVWSGAPGDGSGKDWHNACRSWNEMVIAYNAAETKPSEIWFIDIATPVSGSSTLTVSAELAMRGGFTYECDTISDRKEGAYSVLDSRRAYTLAEINNDSCKVTVERLEFTRSTGRGFHKTGAGSLDIMNCRFTSNGLSSNGDLFGRGFSVAGSASSTHVTVSNCLFAGNGHFSGSGNIMGHGGGAGFRDLKSAVLDNCVFLTNGVMLVDEKSPGKGGDICCGSGAYFSNVPATLRNCVFLSNHGVARNYEGNSPVMGGAIRFDNNCNGSVLSNCIVAGCSDRSGHNNDSQIGYHGGAITVYMSSTAYTVDVVNSTIAYNLSNGHSCPGGINVYTGTVNLENSIVCNNFSSRRANAANRFGADIDVKETGVLNARFTLFTEDSTNSLSWAEGATVNLGEGVIYGDSLFVTGIADVKRNIGNPFATDGKETYFYAGKEGALTLFNVHLRGGRGYLDEKTGALVTTYAKEADSPALDAGDPEAGIAGEADCAQGWHGRRVNLGAYGNTPYATMTPFPGAVLRLR